MNTLVKNVSRCMRNIIVPNKSATLNLSTNNVSKQLSKPALRQLPSRIRQIDPFGWCLLAIPVASFSLGVWQIQRKKWKDALILSMNDKVSIDPVKLPENLEDVKDLEYRQVHVRGTFLHDKEMLLGPRTLLTRGDASTKSSLIGSNTNTHQGYCVVTPLKLEDRDEIILVNRGWVPSKKRDSRSRPKGQVDGVVDVIGIVRLHEPRPTFSMKNTEGSNMFMYRDLNTMCKLTGASPVFLDATDELNPDGGPIGGQTRVVLRNEHMSYILTWFSLCGATSYMWYRKFLVR